MNNIPVLIDGPNYINRLLDVPIAIPHLARQVRIRGLTAFLDLQLQKVEGITDTCGTVEFFCSPKRFGPEKNKFSEPQQTQLLDRIRKEVGVHVDIINIPGSTEKGVDATISGRLEDLAGKVPAAILVSLDRDFIPTLHKLRHKLRVIVFSVPDQPPVELQNEAYATITVGNLSSWLFEYHYPRFNMNDLTEEQFAELVAEADDRQINQLRVEHDGDVYIERRGPDELPLDIAKFYWESWGRYNDYTGPVAASNPKYIKHEFQELQEAWKEGRKGYIDY